MPKAVIFDVDGTLVDSVDLHTRAWQQAFEVFGHKIEFGHLRSQIGKGGDQLMPVFLTPQELEQIGDGLEKYRSQIFKQTYLSQVRGFPRTRPLFKRLLVDKIKVALASSAKGDELETYKKIADIEDLVDAETSSDNAERSKPHPDIFQAALQKLGRVSPHEVLAVGDTPYDAEAAAKAGIRTIGLCCGGWSVQELEEAGCVAVYKDPEDLLTQYDVSPLKN